MVFFDSNILIYGLDIRDASKQRRAHSVMAEAADAGHACISTQVLVETFDVATRRLRLDSAAVVAALDTLQSWHTVTTDTALVRAALLRARDDPRRIYDAMIIEAALRCGATILYSEDMQAGRRYGNLQLLNPFS